uniref:Putative TPR-repeat-containing chaperone protein DNAJ n=1 Tax=Trypanosoma congolense (strain IL3000) TaxID=1068625 RepID=G0UQ12_TRYCI|nr:putative TPR-repeat-containing chaperone protein DNAJ [Trypanosoma congolense IL3000]
MDSMEEAAVAKFHRLVALGALLTALFAACGDCDSTADDEITKKLLLAGDAALRQGRSHYQEALAKYTEALSHSPNSIRGLYSRAELLSMMRRREASLSDLDQLLGLDEKHQRGLVLRSTLYSQTGQLLEAMEDIKKLILMMKEAGRADKVADLTKKMQQLLQYAEAWLPLQQKIQLAKKNETALTRDEQCLCVNVLHSMIRELAKDGLGLRLQRAECALACGDNRAASEELKYVVQREPHNLEAVALNARALRALGAIEHSRKELRRCLSLDPEYAQCAHLHKLVREQARVTQAVEKALEEKHYGKVLELVEGALRFEENAPYKDQLLGWRCDANVGLQDVKAGLAACDEAMKLYSPEDPTVVGILLQKLELYILDENMDAVEDMLQQAQKLQPNDSRLHEYKRKVERLKRVGLRKNYYKILGVKNTASHAEIRRAYRHLAKTYHPDKLKSQDLTKEERQEADKRFRDINEAKEILLDDEKRARYDSGEDPTKPPGFDGNPFHGQPFNFPSEMFTQGGRFQQFYFRFD